MSPLVGVASATILFQFNPGPSWIAGKIAAEAAPTSRSDEPRVQTARTNRDGVSDGQQLDEVLFLRFRHRSKIRHAHFGHGKVDKFG